MTRQHIALQFAAAYLDQARRDTAAGRDELAKFCLQKRRDCQLELLSIREAR